MYKSNVKKNLLQVSRKLWDEAIYDAEKQIEEAQRKIANLKRGINAFKERRDNGEPFPSGDQRQSVAEK